MLLKVFLRTLLVLPFKSCYNNIILPCGHSKWPVTWKWPPSLALGNDFWETIVGELPEVTVTAGSCGGLDARPAIWPNILIYYHCSFPVQLQQTETPDEKLCIFHPGHCKTLMENFNSPNTLKVPTTTMISTVIVAEFNTLAIICGVVPADV